MFAVELIGQYDQRADFAAECLQLVTEAEKPLVRFAKVYVLSGNLTQENLVAIKEHIINPIESKEARLGEYETLQLKYEEPANVKILQDFIDLDETGLNQFLAKYELAMDLDDLLFCQDYFKNEKRNPTITEIRVIDTYWSDHCRHTTFLTNIDKVTFKMNCLKILIKNILRLDQN